MKYEIIPGVGYSTENTQTRIRIKRVRMYSEWIFRLRVRAHVMCMHSESKNPLRIHAHTFYAYSCLRVFSRITHPWSSVSSVPPPFGKPYWDGLILLLIVRKLLIYEIIMCSKILLIEEVKDIGR